MQHSDEFEHALSALHETPQLDCPHGVAWQFGGHTLHAPSEHVPASHGHTIDSPHALRVTPQVEPVQGFVARQHSSPRQASSLVEPSSVTAPSFPSLAASASRNVSSKSHAAAAGMPAAIVTMTTPRAQSGIRGSYRTRDEPLGFCSRPGSTAFVCRQSAHAPPLHVPVVQVQLTKMPQPLSIGPQLAPVHGFDGWQHVLLRQTSPELAHLPPLPQY
jgi:hypothetical protein